MKTSNIQIGKKYMLSLGRRGSITVTIFGARRDPQLGLLFAGLDASGNPRTSISARRLSPCPVTDRDGNLLGYAHEGVGQ